MIDISTLYCEIIISCGKLLVKVANVAPAPIATNIAGIAQHINVEDDTTRLIIPNSDDLISRGIFYSSFIITFVAVWPLIRNMFFISSISIFLVDK